MTPSDDSRDVPLLSRLHFAIILTAVVVFFLVGMGPVWEEPFNYDRLAWSIIWSYVPIPFLVPVFLAVSGKLTWRSWLLGSVVLVMTKFGITATIMVIIWSVAGPPPPGSSMSRPRLIEFMPAPSPMQPPPVLGISAGRVSGRVLDASGAPVRGVLVWLTDLTPRTHPRRRDVVVLTNAGRGLTPRVAAVQAGQPLILRSLDGRAHTMMGELPGGRSAFNHAMLPTGPDRPVVLPVAVGEVAVRCTIHADEARSRLLVLPHPYVGITGVDGAFAFERVPRGRITAAAAIGGEDWTAQGMLRGGALTIDIVPPARD